jgi:hypothetical protein
MDPFPSMDDSIQVVKTPSFLIKVLELVLSSIALIEFMADSTPILAPKSKWAVMLGTLVGYIMISIIIIIAALLRTPLPRLLLLVINLSAVLMFIAAGGLIFEQYHNAKEPTGNLMISGLVALLCGVVYCGDFLLTLFNYGDAWRCSSGEQ